MIFRSPYPDVAIPDVPLTPFILRHAERLANKPALIDGVSGRMLTYGSWPRACGASPQDWRGAASARATSSPPSARTCRSSPSPSTGSPRWVARRRRSIRSSPPSEMHRQLADSGARFVLTVPERLATVREAVAGTRVEEIFVLGEAEGATPFQALLQHHEPLPPVAINPAEDIVMLPYSSGTTGRAKGVMLTHRNLIASVLTRRPLLPCRKTTRSSSSHLCSTLPASPC